MSKTTWKSAYGSLLALFILAGTALGDGIMVTNVSLKSGAPETVGSPNGRAFTGSCGSGILDASGNATNSDWYASDATGAGFRGDGWADASAFARVSDRFLGALVDAPRSYAYGGRAVRSAPSGVGP